MKSPPQNEEKKPMGGVSQLTGNNRMIYLLAGVNREPTQMVFTGQGINFVLQMVFQNNINYFKSFDKFLTCTKLVYVDSLLKI